MRTLYRTILLAALLALNAALLEGLALPFTAVFALDLAVLVSVAVFVVRRERDLLHPLAVIFASFALRVGLPVVMLLAGAEPVAGIPRNWAEPRFWQNGFYLCMVGCFAFGFAFLLTPTGWLPARRPGAHAMDAERAPLGRAAQLFMALGMVMWVLHLSANFGGPSGVLAALTSGMVRSERYHVEGTSRYSFVARHMLFWGSLAWGLTRFQQTRRIRTAIVPALVTLVLLISNGGRINAVSPLVLVLVAIWYLKGRMVGTGSVGFGRLGLWAARGLVALVAFVAAGLFVKGYRGGGGFQAAARLASMQAVGHELEFSAWYETGFLHPFAFAIRYGGGNYNPPLGRFLFSGYTAYFAGVRDVIKPGELLIVQVLGVGGWGIHTGAFIDLYMGFGIMGTVAGALALGAALKVAYARFAQGATRIPELIVYGFTLWHIYWVLFESVVGVVSGWFEGMIFLVLLLGLATLLRRPRARRPAAPPRRRAPVPAGAP
jgi:hypothetical protein